MSDPIRIRAQHAAGRTTVLLLMPHPMETGLRKNDSGGFHPAHFITQLHVAVEGRTVLEARMSQAVSANPLLSFRFVGGQPGGRIAVTWTDSRGAQRRDEARIT